MPDAQFVFEAIGTRWQIDIPELPNKLEQNQLLLDIRQRIDQFDQAYSRFRPDSLVTEISKNAGTYTLPADAKALFDIYFALYRLTNGRFTPLIGNTLADAGYDANYSLTPKATVRPVPRWESVLHYTFPHLTVKEPVLLDFGAAGKGYLVDIIAALLHAQGCESFCVDAGGDIVYRTTKNQPLRVGLEHPEEPDEVIGVVNIVNKSICGSAGNRRTWGEYHHIIDPNTLTSPKHIATVWVVADTALLADALTTCLFFVPASVLQPTYQFEYVIMDKDHRIEASPTFPGELFTFS